ncbi:unnamed protein product [Camellia sinensis]
MNGFKPRSPLGVVLHWKVVVTANLTVMVEPFVRDYLGADKKIFKNFTELNSANHTMKVKQSRVRTQRRRSQEERDRERKNRQWEEVMTVPQKVEEKV